MFTTFAQIFESFKSAPSAPAAHAAHRSLPVKPPSGRFVGAIDNCQPKFGFIRHQDFPNNIFFYVTELAGGLTMAHLAKDTIVDFSTSVRASDGQVIATNIALHNAVVAAPRARPPRFCEPVAAPQRAPPATARLIGAIMNPSASHGFIRHENFPSNLFFHKDGLTIGLLMSDLPEGAMVAFSVGANPKNGDQMAVDIGLPAGVAYASRAHRDRIVGAHAAAATAPPPLSAVRAAYHPPSPPKAPLFNVLEPGHIGSGFASTHQRHSPPRSSAAAEAYGVAAARQLHSHSHVPHQQSLMIMGAQPSRSRSHSPPSVQHVDGPSRVGGAWVVGAEVEADESRVLEFKSVDAAHGDVRSWMRDQLLPKLVNGFLNRRPLAREAATGIVLFGVTDTGRVVGMRADRQLRDAIQRDVDSIVRNQKAMNGSAGALTGADVMLDFAPVVRRDARTGVLAEVADLWVGQLSIQSCFDRCPLYSFIEGGHEVSYERWSGSMRKLTLAEIGSRVVAHAEAQQVPGATAGASSSYYGERR
jgi:cold shock CspA family protein